MDWLRITAADVFAARLPVGVWIASLLGSWALAAGALAAGLRPGRHSRPATLGVVSITPSFLHVLMLIVDSALDASIYSGRLISMLATATKN